MIAENGTPKWTLPGSSRSGAGSARFPRGLPFDIAQQYTAQLIINRDSELEIRSDVVAIPLGQGIFRAWSRTLSLIQDIDLVNQRYCSSGATFNFSLAQQARVSLKFIRIESRAGLLFEELGNDTAGQRAVCRRRTRDSHGCRYVNTG